MRFELPKEEKITNHSKYMKIALTLAEKGRGYTSPNPMVGSVIVKNNIIVGKGYHKKAGSNHAEIEAINQAGDNAKGATLYVTMEPCSHTGKTPPCTERIISAGICHVVFAIRDPNPNVTGNGGNFLKTHSIKITSGVCEKEATLLNEFFIKYVKTGLPFVIAKCAATLDGRIATRTGDSKWITGIEARQYAHEIRHSVDCIMVGINTINKDNPRLTTRLCSKKGADPARVILDTNLSISLNANVINQNSNAKTYIITGKNVDPFKKKYIESLGTKIIHVPEKNKKINIIKLLKLLGTLGFTSLLIEGGGEILGSVFSSDLVDKIYFFYAPKLLTGNDGIPICKGYGPETIEKSINIGNLSIQKLGKDVLIQGYIQRN